MTTQKAQLGRIQPGWSSVVRHNDLESYIQPCLSGWSPFQRLHAATFLVGGGSIDILESCRDAWLIK